MNNQLRALDEKPSLRIIASLLEHDKNISTLDDEIEGVGFNTINKTIEVLKQLNLVIEKESPYRIREFTLTDKGKRAAKKVIELKKIIEEEE